LNIPPDSFVRVPAEQLESFGATLAEAAGLPSGRAQQLAGLLVGNDLRGVFSHGTEQLATYARLLRDGVLNPTGKPRVVRETGSSLLMDGDGGLGYFPAYEGTQRLIDKVQSSGIAILVTRNHGHFGAAGLYSRMTLEHDLLCFVTSGHQLTLAADDSVYAAAGGSPMSFSAPTAEEDPLVLDFGAMHDLYSGAPHRDSIAAQAPGIVHRAIGMGAVCQSWGGFLAGVPLDPERADRTFPGANQGSMVIAFRIDLFLPPEQFKAEMDRYVRAVSGLESFVEGQRSFLPGGLEAERFRSYSRDGIPVGETHQEKLESVADEFGVQVPWSR
jgi:LDH2 family malate/lactate/ureidoglycolate dehydrogenase